MKCGNAEPMRRMSALGQKQTFAAHYPRSALGQIQTSFA